MATEYVGVPSPLLAKVKEAADREEISVEELVRDALEQRINGKGFSGVYGIARRRGQQTGVTPENVEGIAEAEIAAHRRER
jgi:hypothetical protein